MFVEYFGLFLACRGSFVVVCEVCLVCGVVVTVIVVQTACELE